MWTLLELNQIDMPPNTAVKEGKPEAFLRQRTGQVQRLIPCCRMHDDVGQIIKSWGCHLQDVTYFVVPAMVRSQLDEPVAEIASYK